MVEILSLIRNCALVGRLSCARVVKVLRAVPPTQYLFLLEVDKSYKNLSVVVLPFHCSLYPPTFSK